jgi:uncharacterized OsmC-like protein/alpha/beta superfamily hydrolase
MSQTQKVEFENTAGHTLAARLELPSGPVQAYAIFAHCFTCSKDIAAATRISRGLCDQGIAVLRFDFTGLGNSDGDFANTNFSSNVQDLISGASFLASEFQAPKLLIGHSLGGAAVLAAAGHIDSVKAVATIGAPADPEHVSHMFNDHLETIESEGEAEVTLAGRKFKIKKQFVDDIRDQSIEKTWGKRRIALMVMHSPIDDIVGIDNATKIFVMAKHPKSFVSLDQADHLLSRKEDSQYVSTVLGAWALRYIGDAQAAHRAEKLDHGDVVVEEIRPPFTQDVRFENHHWHADEPTELNGRDLGPSPYEYLLASLGACTSMTLRMYASHKKLPLEGVKVHLHHDKIHAKDCEACDTEALGKTKVDQIKRTITIEGDELTAEQRARLLEIADRCPVHQTLERKVEILTEAGN